MKSSSTTLFMVLVAIVIVVGSSIIADASIVEDSCKTLSSSVPSANYDFCVQSISSDPGSKTADDKGLAVIATKLCSANATSTHSKIQELLKGAKEKKLITCLGTCEMIYSDALDNLSEASGYVQSGSVDDAITYLSAAVDAPGECEDAFTEQEIPSVLKKENSDGKQLCFISLSFTSFLKH